MPSTKNTSERDGLLKKDTNKGDGAYGTDAESTSKKGVSNDMVVPKTEGEAEPAAPLVASRSRNVVTMMLYNFVDGASFSVWQYQVQQVLIYNVANGSNTTVGLVSGASGLAQAIAALVAGYAGDVLEKSYVSRAGAICGVLAAITTIYAVYSRALLLYYASSAFWGFYCGFAYPASEALFADSISSGKRTAIYTKKYVVQILCYLVGYALNIGLFLKLGDEWGNSTLEMVMYIGVGIHPIAFILLSLLSDKYNLKNMLATMVSKKEQQDALHGTPAAPAKEVEALEQTSVPEDVSKVAIGTRTVSNAAASHRTHDSQVPTTSHYSFYGTGTDDSNHNALQQGVDTFYKSVAAHERTKAMPASSRDPTMALGAFTGFDGPTTSSFFVQNNFQEKRENVIAGAALDAADAVNSSMGFHSRKGSAYGGGGASRRSHGSYGQSQRSTTAAGAHNHLSVRSEGPPHAGMDGQRANSADSKRAVSAQQFSLGMGSEASPSVHRQGTEDITGADILEIVLLQNATAASTHATPSHSPAATKGKSGRSYTQGSFTRSNTAHDLATPKGAYSYRDPKSTNDLTSLSQRMKSEAILIESILPVATRERARSRMNLCTSFGNKPNGTTTPDNAPLDPNSNRSHDDGPEGLSMPKSPEGELNDAVAEAVSAPPPTKPSFTPLEKVEMYFKHRTRVADILAKEGSASLYPHLGKSSKADNNKGFLSAIFGPSRRATDKVSLLHNERDVGGRERTTKGYRKDIDDDTRSESTIASRMTMETKTHLDTKHNSADNSKDEISSPSLPRYGAQGNINDDDDHDSSRRHNRVVVINSKANSTIPMDDANYDPSSPEGRTMRFLSLGEEELYELLEDGEIEEIIAFVDWVNDSANADELENSSQYGDDGNGGNCITSLCGPKGPCYKPPCMAWHDNYNIIPFLTVSADFIQAIGSGMTVRFLTLFFVNDYDLKPIVVTITFIIITCLSAGIAQVMSLLAARLQRLPLILGVRLIGTTALMLMAILPKIDPDNKDSFIHSIGLLLTIFVIRQGAMNSSMGISRAVVMDTVRPESRTKWSSMESFASFSWAGSAAVGGVIADAHGYGATFLVTACLHYFSCMLIIPAAIASRRLERIVLSMNAKDRAAKKEKEDIAKQLKAFEKAEADRVKRFEKERRKNAANQ